MLRHLGEKDAAQAIEDALVKVAASGKFLTFDLGGSTGTKAFTDALVAEMNR